MNAKPIAMLVVTIAIASMCAFCLLGPAVIGAFFAGWFGWLADLSLDQGIVLGFIVAARVVGLGKIRRLCRFHENRWGKRKIKNLVHEKKLTVWSPLELANLNFMIKFPVRDGRIFNERLRHL